VKKTNDEIENGFSHRVRYLILQFDGLEKT
jgi:hypothetical protein